MYAGTSTVYRGRGDAALLRFEAMRWARDGGCLTYDLGGITPRRSSLTGSQEVADPTRPGSDLDGVQQFKVGFGGEIVVHPQTVERRYRPFLAWCVRLVYARFRVSPGLSVKAETGNGIASVNAAVLLAIGAW